MDSIFKEIAAEIQSQSHQDNAIAFDPVNRRNDYVAIATAYLGRAADRCPRNSREGCDPRSMLIKAAAVCISGIAAYNRCPGVKPV